MAQSWKKSFLLIGLVGFTGSANAQTTFSIGPQLGLNVTSARYRYNTTSFYDYNTETLNRLEAGITANISYGHFIIQPAVLYSQKGFVLKFSLLTYYSGSSRPINAQLTSYLNYITIPTNFVYAQKSSGEGFQVFGGGYVGFFLGGKRQVHDEYANSSTGTNFYDAELPIKPGERPENGSDFYSKKIDLGIQAGLGYKYRSALIQITYGMGLKNLEMTYSMVPLDNDPTYYNKTLTMSISYLLKLTKSGSH